MGIDYTVTLRNAQELAAWEQSAQAAAKAEKQLLKNAQQYKGVETAAKAFQQQQKAIAETESQIERERAANSQADISRLQKKLEMMRRVSAEIQNTAAREAARESQAYTTAFATGSRRGSYSSFPSDDPFQAGLRRMANDRRVAEETARAAQNAFISGRGGLSGSAERDSWGEGMSRITGQNAAAAKKAAEETAAAQRRLVEEVNRLRVTPLEQYTERMAKLKELLRSGAIDQRGFNAAAKDAAEKMAAAGKAGDDSFGERARAALQSYIAGFLSFTAVLALARRGWDALTKAQEEYLNKSREILDFQLSLAGSQANAILNFTGLSEDRTASVIEREVPAMQQRTGFGDQRQLLNAVASGYAASGDIDLAMKAAESAAKINRNTPDQIGVQTGAALDIMRHTGIKDADVALSFLLQANPRGTDPVKIAQNLPPVLGMAKNASQTDDDLEAARAGAAIFTALGRAGTDLTGEQSGTATNKFIELQREFFKKNGGYARKEGYDVSTIPGRMNALEKDEKLRNAFLKNMSKKGAVEYRPAIENLIAPGSDLNKEFHSEFDRLQFRRESYDEIERKMGRIGQLPLGNLAAQGKANDQFSSLTAEGKKRALEALAWQGDDKQTGAKQVLEKTSRGMESTLEGMHYGIVRGAEYLGEGVAGSDSGIDEYAEKRIRQRLRIRRYDLGASERWGNKTAAAQYRDDIKALEQQLAILTQIREKLDAISKSNDAMVDQPPVEIKMPAPSPNGGGRN
jgi:hypothetical protein